MTPAQMPIDQKVKRLLASKLNEPLTRAEANYILSALSIEPLAKQIVTSLAATAPSPMVHKKPLTVIAPGAMCDPFDFVLPPIQDYSL